MSNELSEEDKKFLDDIDQDIDYIIDVYYSGLVNPIIEKIKNKILELKNN